MLTLLKSLVGSRAYGLEHPDSDYDHRGIYITPTQELLSLQHEKDEVRKISEDKDDVMWEVGKFLRMSLQNNPTALELFLAPSDESLEPYATELKSLFPYVWSSEGVHKAFIGYSRSQRSNFMDLDGKRAHKFALANVRVLYNAQELLTEGTFTVRIVDTPVNWFVKALKENRLSREEILRVIENYESDVHRAYEVNKKHESDVSKLNDFLLRARKDFW